MSTDPTSFRIWLIITSDYDIEPVLSLTLESHPPTNRDPIYLGTMLRLFASRIGEFQRLLAKPKSVPSSIATTFGRIEPLGFERFRICELYAELLHCSNMVLLNDPCGESVVLERDIERQRLRKEGRIRRAPNVDVCDDPDLGNGRQWGAQPEESEARYSKNEKETLNSNGNHGTPKLEDQNKVQNAGDPVSSHLEIIKSCHDRSDHNVDIPNISESRTEVQPAADAEATAPKEHKAIDDDQQQSQNNARTSTDTNPVANHPVVGDYLKMQFVEAKVLPSVMDLFFAHPWNNFLHNVVYDILTQVLNGPMDKGFNRQLAVDLFTTGQLTEKIVQGQKTSDDAQ